jgi:hypothetical protein
MNAADRVVVVFLYEGDYGDPAKYMQPMEGYVVRRKLVRAGGVTGQGSGS